MHVDGLIVIFDMLCRNMQVGMLYLTWCAEICGQGCVTHVHIHVNAVVDTYLTDTYHRPNIDYATWGNKWEYLTHTFMCQILTLRIGVKKGPFIDT